MNLRDSQRSKLYQAEKCLYKVGRKFESLDEIRSYILKIASDPWVKEKYSGMEEASSEIIVADGRGRRSACFSMMGRMAYFSFPRWSRIESMVLHELAHWILRQERLVYKSNYASHGPEFASILTRLVYRQMGEEAFRNLTYSFRDHGVRYLWLN